jgi:aspartyl-tRNA(Asn)/glutamyl-tRNA(Gln) amidotransferase subunit A
MARLNMVEFALGITGHNDITGHVRNPWNTDHITGGSSSGSGAAVAARLTYGSLGSDTGGSIRFPAACCGVTGIKPTYTRVSRYGAMPLAQSLDCVGPLARTAEDCALMLGAIAGHDERDPLSGRRNVPDYTGGLRKSVVGLRVAVAANHFYDPVSVEVRTHVESSLDVLRDAGAEIIEVTIPGSVAAANLLNNLITGTEGAAFHSRWLRERPEDYGRITLVRFLTGAMCPADRYLEALNLRSVILKDFADAVFSKADLLHVPLMPMPVPTIEKTDFDTNENGFSDFIATAGHCTRCFNYLGLPAASIPCGFTDNGLPVSFQLVGRPFDEATILRTAHAYQRETDWHSLAPEL